MRIIFVICLSLMMVFVSAEASEREVFYSSDCISNFRTPYFELRNRMILLSEIPDAVAEVNSNGTVLYVSLENPDGRIEEIKYYGDFIKQVIHPIRSSYNVSKYVITAYECGDYVTDTYKFVEDDCTP